MSCEKCKSTGLRTYPNSGTWRLGILIHQIVCHALTEDICNVCWGTGDTQNPGKNLIEAEERQVRELVEETLIRLVGEAGEISPRDLENALPRKVRPYVRRGIQQFVEATGTLRINDNLKLELVEKEEE